MLLLAFLLKAHATHLVYSAPSVTIPGQLLSILTSTTVTLPVPLALLSNRKYGVVFKFNEATTRVFMAGTSANQTGLLMSSNKVSSWDKQFYMKPNVGVSPVSVAATAVSLDPTDGTQGFGQTFDSGVGGILSTLELLGGALIQFDTSVTVQIYDLTNWNGTVAFPYFQETLSPTTKMPTLSPTTISPTAVPTTTVPTTTAPTTTMPTTTTPTTLTTTHDTAHTAAIVLWAVACRHRARAMKSYG